MGKKQGDKAESLMEAAQSLGGVISDTGVDIDPHSSASGGDALWENESDNNETQSTGEEGFLDDARYSATTIDDSQFPDVIDQAGGEASFFMFYDRKQITITLRGRNPIDIIDSVSAFIHHALEAGWKTNDEHTQQPVSEKFDSSIIYDMNIDGMSISPNPTNQDTVWISFFADGQRVLRNTLYKTKLIQMLKNVGTWNISQLDVQETKKYDVNCIIQYSKAKSTAGGVYNRLVDMKMA